MNGNMNLGKRVTALEQGNGSDIEARLETLEGVVEQLEDDVEQLENSIDQSLSYSTQEHIVGKWIDGRPYYEKTIVKDGGFVSGDNNIPHNIDNIDLLSCEMNGCVRDSENVGLIVKYYNAQNTRSAHLTDSYLSIYGAGQFIPNYIRITIRYAKTTDTQ